MTSIVYKRATKKSKGWNMKVFLSAVMIASFTMSSAMAAPRTVRDNVIALSQLGNGYSEQKFAGKNAAEIFENFLVKETGEFEGLVNKEIDEMAYGDEIDEGFTSTKSAMEMSSFLESMLEERLEGLDSVEDAQKILEIKGQIYDLNHGWAKIIKNLDRQGVKFGYTGFGPGYCGISFVEMIIIDSSEQKVYEVYLSEGGSC